MSTFLAAMLFVLAFSPHQVGASGDLTNIYIRADGSVEPAGSPVSSPDDTTYFLEADLVNKSVVIERDNIVFDGQHHTIQGPMEIGTIGVNVTGRTGVTVKDTNVRGFDLNFYVLQCRNVTLSGNTAADTKIFVFMEPIDFFYTGTGISISRSANITITGNNASGNIFGLSIYQSNHTLLSGNTVCSNKKRDGTDVWGVGMSISDTNTSIVTGNNVSDNGIVGISLISATPDYPCNDNIIANNTVSANIDYATYTYGIQASGVRNVTVANNTLNQNTYGIHVRYYSQNNTIAGNNASANSFGILLEDTEKTTVTRNVLSGNAEAVSLNNASNNDILRNKVFGSSSYGIHLRDGSRNNALQWNTISSNAYGIRIVQSPNNNVTFNNIASNLHTGLTIYYYSSNTQVGDNNVTQNVDGLVITYECYGTRLFHNNFMDNMRHVYTDMNSTWDKGYPLGGNYWSNYTGTDQHSGPLQDEAGSDGIGDTAHQINGNNNDSYPLMAPVYVFEAGTWDTTTSYVDMVSNSTISAFAVDATAKTLSFTAAGESGQGFCRAIIPNNMTQIMWHGNYKVLVDGTPVEFMNWTDSDYTYIYFAYQHSEHGITIVPEHFPIAVLTILVLSAALTTALARRTRKSRTPHPFY